MGFIVLYGFDGAPFNFITVFWLVVSVPVFVVHVEYYICNRTSKLTFLKESLRFEEGKKLIEARLGEVEKIEFSRSRNVSRWKMQWWAHESYCFARFFLRSGETFVVTNLMVSNIETLLSNFSENQVERLNAIYPSLSLPIVIPNSWIIDKSR